MSSVDTTRTSRSGIIATLEDGKKLALIDKAFTTKNLQKLVGNHPDLSSLSFNTVKKYHGKFLSDEGLEVLRQSLKDLKKFKLISDTSDGFDNLTGKGLETLIKSFPNLTSLRFDGCSFITGKESAQLFETCSHLKKVRISTDEFLRDDTLNKILGNNPTLTHLTLIGIPSNDDDSNHALSDQFLNQLSKCQNLVKLKLTLPATPFSKKAVSDFFLSLPSLERLTFITKTALKDTLIEKISKACPKVNAVHLGSCKKMTTKSIETLKSRENKIKKISLFKVSKELKPMIDSDGVLTQ